MKKNYTLFVLVYYFVIPLSRLGIKPNLLFNARCWINKYFIGFYKAV